MLTLMQLLRWKRSNVPQRSYSALIDFQQIHVRNMFLFCFGLCTVRQFFSNNIMCHTNGHAINPDFVETKCFINGTFTDLSHMDNPVAPLIKHDYYQWVPLVLLLLSFSFHFPFRIWFKQTGTFIKELTSGVKTTEDCTRIIELIVESRGDGLFWKTFGLECLYIIHLFLHLVLLNQFFNHIWSLSGWSWTAISLLFPEMVSCFYDYFTSGGGTEGKFKCLLPLNSVYRKVFWVIYVTYILLIQLHILFFMYRFFLIVKWGKEWINGWWCLQLAKQSAETWHAKDNLKQQWGKLKRKTDPAYICMEELLTVKQREN